MLGQDGDHERPLDRIYPVVFIDALVFKIRDGGFYVEAFTDTAMRFLLGKVRV